MHIGLGTEHAGSQFVCRADGGPAKEETMSDFHHDPNIPRNGFEDMQPYERRVQWAAVGVLLLLCGGIFLAAMFSGNDNQTAMNSPSAETTGSANSTLATPPAQLRK
jgi:hypothetical protein